ncbi:MAG: hypothetical protein OHK0053_28580 [Microscillaceae bacterium]
MFGLALSPSLKAQTAFGVNGDGDIVRFDLSNPGVFEAVVGSSGAAQFPGGLDADATGNWYLCDAANTQFWYKLNQVTGIAELLGGTGVASGQTPTDLSWDDFNKRMLMLTTDLTINSQIYEVNVTTGVATLLGTVTAETVGVSLAVDPTNGDIYLQGNVTDTWYRVNPTTFTATALNPLPFDANFGQGGNFAADGSVIYHAAFNAGSFAAELWSVNKTTGTATLIGAFPPGEQISDMFVFQPFTNDLALGSIGFNPCSGEVSVLIGNIGTSNQSNFGVSYTQTPGATVSETVTQTLAPFDVTLYTFATPANVAPNTYTIAASIVPADGNETNNTLAPLNVTVGTAINTFPYEEDFEAGLPASWSQETQATDGGWLPGTAGSLSSAFWTIPATNNTNIVATNDDACNCNKEQERLITPIFDLSGFAPGDGVRLEFDAYFDGAFGGDGFVEVSTDGGQTWTQLLELTNVTSWRQVGVSLNPYIGQSCVQIAFRYDDNGFFAAGYAVDNVVVKEVFPFDVGVSAIVSPRSPGFCLDNDVPVTVQITNFGFNTAFNFNVSFVANGGAPVTVTFPDAIPPFSSVNYTFTPTADLSLANNTLEAFTGPTINGNADGDATNNNSGVVNIENLDGEPVPFVQNFEAGVFPALWSQQTLATDGGWLIGTAASLSSAFWQIPATNSTTIIATNDDACNCNKNNERLITPAIDLGLVTPGNQARLSFDTFFNGTFGGTGFVDISVDGGANWIQLRQLAAQAAWRNEQIDLTPYLGQCVQIAFRYNDNGFFAAGYAIDNVNIREVPPLDAGVIAVVAPGNSAFCLGTAETITVRVQNFGFQAITGFNVSYVANGGATVTETFTGNIPAFGVANYTFTQTADLSGPTSTINAFTTLAGDANAGNDALNGYAITNEVPVAFPFTTNFDINPFTQNWVLTTNGVGWLYGDAADLSSAFWEIPDVGSGNMVAMNDDAPGPTNNAAFDRLATPAIDISSIIPGNQLRLEFDAYYEGAVFFGPLERASVEISTNGTTWTRVLTLTGDDAWQSYSVDISQFIGESCIIVSFVYEDLGQWAFGFAVDNVNLRQVFAQDAGVAAITRPQEQGYCLGQESVRAQIRNYGFEAITNFPVTYTVNGGAPVTENFTGTIPPFGTANFTFATQADFSVATNNVQAFTGLTNDGNPSNDSFGPATVLNLLSGNVPLVDDFEGADPLAGNWRKRFETPSDGSWSQGTVADFSIPNFYEIPAPPSGTQFMATVEIDNWNKIADRLILPPLDFAITEGTRITFDAYFQREFGERAFLQISTDGGNNWITVQEIAGLEGQWQNYEVSLFDYRDESCVLLSFLYSDNNGFALGLAIDNVNVQLIPPFDARLGDISLSACSQNFAPLTVAIENRGTQPISNFEVSYTLNGTTVTEVVGAVIPPFTTFNYTFTTTIDISGGGPFVFNVEVTLADDANLADNVLTGVNVSPTLAATLPFSQNFEAQTGIPNGWQVITTGVGWLFGTSGTLSSAFWNIPGGTGNLVAMNDDAPGPANNASADRLIMSPFNFSAYSDVTMTFSGFFNGAFGGTAFVQASIDGGASWQTVLQLTPSGSFLAREAVLDAFAGEPNVLVSFLYRDNGFWADGFAVDNIVIDGTPLPSANVAIQTPAVADAEVLQGTTNHVIYRLDMAVTNVNTLLKDLIFRTGGTYDVDDIVPGSVKLWQSSTENVADAQVIATRNILPSGGLIAFSCIDVLLEEGETTYFFLSVDIAPNGTDGNTIFIVTPTLDDVAFSMASVTGTFVSGGVQTIVRFNTPPIGSDKVIRIGQNSSYAHTAADFEFQDPDVDPVDVLTTIRIEALNLPAGATLTFNGTPVSVGLEIPAASIPNLVFTPATGAAGDAYASFDFRLNDGRAFSIFAYSIIFDVNLVTTLFVPTLFSPNGDGQNENFRLFLGGQGIARLTLKIFDRNNNLVFETSDVNTATQTGWDGTNEGKEQPSGAYIWFLEGTFDDGTPVEYNGKNTGVIRLLR